MTNKLHDLLRPIYRQVEQPLSRRAWLRAAGLGFGSVGLTAMMAEEARLFAAPQDANPLAPKAPHFPAKAKRVIFLFMHGGPSSIDTFDPKERLVRDHGKPLPIKRPLAFADGPIGPLMKPLWDFKPGGKSGVPVSDSSGNRRSYGFAQETRPTMRLTVVAVVMAVEAVESNEPAVRALSCPGCR